MQWFYFLDGSEGPKLACLSPLSLWNLLINYWNKGHYYVVACMSALATVMQHLCYTWPLSTIFKARLQLSCSDKTQRFLTVLSKKHNGEAETAGETQLQKDFVRLTITSCLSKPMFAECNIHRCNLWNKDAWWQTSILKQRSHLVHLFAKPIKETLINTTHSPISNHLHTILRWSLSPIKQTWKIQSVVISKKFTYVWNSVITCRAWDTKSVLSASSPQVTYGTALCAHHQNWAHDQVPVLHGACHKLVASIFDNVPASSKGIMSYDETHLPCN